MKPRLPTPSGGSVPVITLQAKSHQALMSATAKQVAALQEGEENLETVLVVYSENHAASVFCEQGTPVVPKAGPQR